MVKPAFRTKSLGTKVTPEECARLEALAAARGLTMSEWVREVAGGPGLESELTVPHVCPPLADVGTTFPNLEFEK